LFGFLAILAGQQAWMMLSSMTTYEMIKGPEAIEYLSGTDDCDLPFSRDICSNIGRFVSRDSIFTNALYCLTRDERYLSWAPSTHSLPASIDRKADNITDNLWQNRYYSCC
jgi:hypothetical protein